MNLLIDDQLLGTVLRGHRPRSLPRRATLFTTGYWYVRLCQAALNVADRTGVLSAPFAALPADQRERAVAAVLELPEEVGLVGMRTLGPLIARLRGRHRLNILGSEALAAAVYLEAEVALSARSPRLERALVAESRRVRRV